MQKCIKCDDSWSNFNAIDEKGGKPNVAKKTSFKKRLKAARGNSKTPFADVWFRLQVKLYGFEKAWAMHHAGNCNPRKITNQLKSKVAGV
jgi:hypothetical protein